MPNLVSLTHPSLQILEKTQTGVFFASFIRHDSLFRHLQSKRYFRFPDSGQSFIQENHHNSRARYDIDMKLGLVTKLCKKNKTTSKKFGDDIMSANYDVIIIFPNYGQFEAIRKPNTGRIVCKIYIFIKSNLLSYEN